MLPLCYGNTNQSYTIIRVKGPRRCHAEALGFVPGESVNIIQSANGNLIVSLRDSRYAISKEQAKSIFVKENQC